MGRWGVWNNGNCYLKSIMILHYDFSKYLVPWMSPPCIAILLQTGDWPEFWYQHHFRYCRLDIAYKISKLFQRDQMLTTILVLCPCTWFSSAIGQFMKLRVPQHIPDHFHNPYPCVCNDWNVTARDCYWQCAMSDHSNSRVGLNFFILAFCMCSVHERLNELLIQPYSFDLPPL